MRLLIGGHDHGDPRLLGVEVQYFNQEGPFKFYRWTSSAADRELGGNDAGCGPREFVPRSEPTIA